MVGELVDGVAGEVAGRRLGLALERPLDREVLPEQHPAAVGLVVELGAGDVAVDAHEVEPGVGGQRDVGGDLAGRGLGQQLAGGADGRRPSGRGARR